MSAEHRIVVELGTEKMGMTARYLLQQPEIKLKRIPCPYCAAIIDIPETLEPHVRELAAKSGGEKTYLTWSIIHPGSVPKTKTLGGARFGLGSPEAEELLKKAKRDS